MAQAIGAIGLGLSLAGGMQSANAAAEKGYATQRVYDYQAGIAKVNSLINKQNADWASVTGEVQAAQYGMKSAYQQSQIRSTQAASGLDVNTGSNAEVQASQAKIGRMDMDQIRTNAAKTAYDYRVAADNDLRQAGLYTLAGQNAARSGELDRVSSYIGTATSVSSKWLQGNQAGLWGSSSSGYGPITLYGPNQNITGYTA